MGPSWVRCPGWHTVSSQGAATQAHLGHEVRNVSSCQPLVIGGVLGKVLEPQTLPQRSRAGLSRVLWGRKAQVCV